jgi:(p)ppGpp synthase/HD superfamily hydrolase
MLEIAFKIAQEAFKGKTDKAGKPYFMHLERVENAICVQYPSINNEIKCIALLHDLLEDCPEWNEKSLSCFFNQRVINGIVAMTHKKGQSYDDYISQVLENSDARTVKKFDLLDNMDITRLSELSEKDLLRIKKYHTAYTRIVAF